MISKPIIYALCPDRQEHLGGTKALYRHVDVLNQNGFSAFILHHKKGFRCRWFSNQTPVVYATDIRIRRQDYLIVPEIYGPQIANIAKGTKKVIFNQNAYLTFTGYPPQPASFPIPYQHRDIVAAIVVSEDSRRYLSYVFPKLCIFRMCAGINPDRFNPGLVKAAQIAFMPRKLPEDAIQITHILKTKGLLKNFKLAPIVNRQEHEVSRILKKSLIFLSLSSQEGCAAPPLEAMACGCVVVGYTGRGGQEYFKREFSYPIEDGDIIGFSKTLAKLIRQYQKNKTALFKKGLQAAEFARKEYSLEREEKDIVRIWKNILPRFANRSPKP